MVKLQPGRGMRDVFLLISFLVSPAVLQAANAAPPAIAVGETSVVVTDLAPGATIALFGGAREANGGMQLLRWRVPLEDADRDGAVELKLNRIIPRDSVWIAVDTDTGATAVAVPARSRFRQITFPEVVLPKGPDAKIERYVTGRRMVDLLVVRPHVGAWMAAAADGHDSDGDGRHDGRTTIVFADIRNLAGHAPAPRHLTSRDVVVAVDVRRMEYYLTEVAE